MRDLTTGSVLGHLLGMAGFIAFGMIFTTLYFLVDLYFVSTLGAAAIAGVSAAGLVFFLAMSGGQLIGVGALSLIAQAIGRKDAAAADAAFNQTFSLSLILSLALVVLGLALGPAAMKALAATPEAAHAGWLYLCGYLPGLAMMFPSAALGSSLRAAGSVRGPTLIQTASVAVNVALAPVLIAGWGTNVSLGTFGAGLASTIATAVGFGLLLVIFPRAQSVMRLALPAMRPDFPLYGRIVGVGLPATGEFLMMFIITGVIYSVLRPFGEAAQAGFGVGSQLSRAIFLPAMAVAFAAAPVAGQNFGARLPSRVREVFRLALVINGAVMGIVALLCHISPEALAAPFSKDPAVIAAAAEFLMITSWSFPLVGIVFTCSGLFQALGDTRPALLSSASRILTYIAPAIWIGAQPWATLEHIWWLSVASVAVQAAISLVLLNRTFGKLLPEPAPLEARTAPVK